MTGGLRSRVTPMHQAQHQTSAAVRDEAPTILLAEDHEDTRLVDSMVLLHFGYVVEEAVTGDAAVERARAVLPDLILMDIGLPVLDGWEAARRLKSNEMTAAIPLVAFSALIDSVADLRADTLTFDGFIAKPVS